MAILDDRGRVADRSVVQSLAWRDGDRLEVSLVDGLIHFRPSSAGVHGLAGRGRVQLPMALRRACNLERGDRVLLAGEPGAGTLVVYPPASLDAMLDTLTPPVPAGAA